MNGSPVSEGRAGPMSLHLGAALKKIWAGEDTRFEHWLDFVEEER